MAQKRNSKIRITTLRKDQGKEKMKLRLAGRR